MWFGGIYEGENVVGNVGRNSCQGIVLFALGKNNFLFEKVVHKKPVELRLTRANAKLEDLPEPSH